MFNLNVVFFINYKGRNGKVATALRSWKKFLSERVPCKGEIIAIQRYDIEPNFTFVFNVESVTWDTVEGSWTVHGLPIVCGSDPDVDAKSLIGEGWNVELRGP